MLETVIGWVTGHIADVLGPMLASVAALCVGMKMGRDGAVKAAQGAVLEKAKEAATVTATVAALPDDELERKQKEWTR